MTTTPYDTIFPSGDAPRVAGTEILRTVRSEGSAFEPISLPCSPSRATTLAVGSPTRHREGGLQPRRSRRPRNRRCLTWRYPRGG